MSMNTQTVFSLHTRRYISYVRSFGSVLDLCKTQVLCNSQFKVDGRWHTWIDFDKFIELVSFLCLLGIIIIQFSL